MQYRATGRQPPRRANRDHNHCPHGVYPARPSEHSEDEWVAIAMAPEDDWPALCRLVGRDDLAADRRFDHHAARKANEAELDEIVAAWTSRHDKWEAAERCQAIGVAAAAVEHLADTFGRDPQLGHHYQVVSQPSDPGVAIPIDREAARWRGREHQLRRSPGLGEHNEHVVCELLGRSEHEYVQLVIDEVLG
jgi:crotonobetainyl-CoA:carnitine CoA-transferase CaiB-like acyl-CoA transferase